MNIEAVRGDITTQAVDAVVNAANSTLLGGGGVDGAIHRAAGPELLEACRELRRTVLPHGLPVGEAVATPGYRLPARWVIHTVGPNRRAGQTDPALLRAAFDSALTLAMDMGCRSVAVPAVSAGVYGWDRLEVARIAVAAARAAGALVEDAQARAAVLPDDSPAAGANDESDEAAPGAEMEAPGADVEAPGADVEAPGADVEAPGAEMEAPVLELVRFVLFSDALEAAFSAELAR